MVRNLIGSMMHASPIAVALTLCACATNSSTDETSFAGAAGTSFGGSSAGGSTQGTGGKATGGTSSGGSGNSSTGGNSNTGGKSTGGSSTGGSHTGGTSTGGTATGGTSTGGTSTGGTSTGGTSTGGTSGNPGVRIVGRTDGNTTSPSFEWPGVSIQARFQGTSVSVDLDGGNNNFFEIIIDGQDKGKIATTAGRKTIQLASGLSNATHDLVFWRRTEALNWAPSRYYGLTIGGGSLLAPNVPAHKLEVIGDSITCGYGDEGANQYCGFTYDTENNYMAWGSVASRQVGADLYTECWSGIGVYRDGGGSTTDQMPVRFQRAIPTDTASTWAFAWKPDVVVIDLGTNDFANGDPGSGYVTAFKSFVQSLRGHYPNAYIILMIGPMLTDNPTPKLTTARGYLDQVVQAQKNAGDNKIEQFQIAVQDINANGAGCDWHPSIKTHDIIGKAVAAEIKSKLGW